MGSPTYIPLATITLTGAASSVTFSSIPQTYRDLVLVVSGKTNVTGPDSTILRMNGDSGSNYSNVRMVGTGSSATSASGADTGNWIAVYTNSSNTGNIITQIMDYSATDKHKTTLSRGNQDNGWVAAFAGRWANTAAVTSLTVTPPVGSSWTFSTDSTFSLFGISG